MMADGSPVNLNRRPLRKTQFTLLAICILIVGGWVFSSFYLCMFVDSTGTLVHLRDGGIWTTTNKWDYVMSKAHHGTHVSRHTSRVFFPTGRDLPGWTVMPFWLLLVLPACALVLIFVWTMPAKRRLGKCQQCGYDLRGSPGQCPECGNHSVDMSGR